MASGIAVWVAVWFTGTVVVHFAKDLLLPVKERTEKKKEKENDDDDHGKKENGEPKKSISKGNIGTTSSVNVVLAVMCFPMSLAAFAIDKEDTLMRGVVAMSGGFYAFRSIQTMLEERFENEPIQFRMLHVGCSFHDIHRCERGIHSDKKTQIIKKSTQKMVVSLFGLIMVILAFQNRVFLSQLLFESGKRRKTSAFILACLCGGLYADLSLDIFGLSLQICLALLNIRAPLLQDSPLDSLSLKEFWGKRWDTVIQEILGSYVYLPLRQRKIASRSQATVAVFFASGMIHVWPLFVAGMSSRDALMMLSYFLTQCFLLFIEQQVIMIPKFTNEIIRRLWVLTAIGLPLPLIVLPSLRLAGVKVM